MRLNQAEFADLVTRSVRRFLLASGTPQPVAEYSSRRHGRALNEGAAPRPRDSTWSSGLALCAASLPSSAHFEAGVGEAEMRALDNVREVYGVRGIRFNKKDRSVRVEFDASRFKEPVIAALLRQAGVDIQEKLVLA